MPGDADLLGAARSALLDALDALGSHRDAVVLIGAQAIYLHTGAADVALAEATKDSDLAIDPRVLEDEPRIEEVMEGAGFRRNLTDPQPGSWLNDVGVPVDFLVPDSMVSGNRGARMPPHSKHAARKATGLEAALVDRAPQEIVALTPDDRRRHTIEVAGPAALVVAKLHKLGDRRGTPGRLNDKDAHDLYRLLVAIPTEQLASGVGRLLGDTLSAETTTKALRLLYELFAAGPDALGSHMAGRAEGIAIGTPEIAAASAAVLASDLLVDLGD